MLRNIEKMNFSENDLIKEIFNFQKSSVWADSRYPYPGGILNENLASAPDGVPEFFLKTCPGSNRG